MLKTASVNNTKMIKQVISKKRVADHGEVFTDKREVNAMLDLVKHETHRVDSRFLEPACGTGNFLVEVLIRKLNIVEKRYKKNQADYEKYSVIAVSSLYGVDILKDNVQLCRKRLYRIFDKKYTTLYKSKCKETLRRTIRFVLKKNILWGDALSLKTPDENAKPIVFSEWSSVKNNLIKRRDYTLANLLASQPLDGLNLFSDLGDEAFIPTPVGDFPLVHYLKIGQI